MGNLKKIDKKITTEMAEKAISEIQRLVTVKMYKKYSGAFRFYSTKRSLVFKGMYQELLPYIKKEKELSLLAEESWVLKKKRYPYDDMEKVQLKKLKTAHAGCPVLYEAACGLEPFPT